MAVEEQNGPNWGRIALSVLTWAAAFFGVLLLVAASAILAFNDSLADQWKYAGAGGIALVGLWVYLARRSLQEAVSSRGARYSFGAVALVAPCPASSWSCRPTRPSPAGRGSSAC